MLWAEAELDCSGAALVVGLGADSEVEAQQVEVLALAVFVSELGMFASVLLQLGNKKHTFSSEPEENFKMQLSFPGLRSQCNIYTALLIPRPGNTFF